MSSEESVPKAYLNEAQLHLVYFKPEHVWDGVRVVDNSESAKYGDRSIELSDELFPTRKFKEGVEVVVEFMCYIGNSMLGHKEILEYMPMKCFYREQEYPVVIRADRRVMSFIDDFKKCVTQAAAGICCGGGGYGFPVNTNRDPIPGFSLIIKANYDSSKRTYVKQKGLWVKE